MDIGKTRHTLMVSKESLGELQAQCQKFEYSCVKLDQRDKELIGMIGDSLRRKDSLRANMYANELVRVRHLKRVFSQSQLALECISIRMENLLELHNAIQMDPISESIREVIGDLQGISPEFTSSLEQLTKTVEETLSQTTIGFKEPVLEEVFSASSPESIAILKEVSQTIEGSLKEAFPEPPIVISPKTSQLEEPIGYSYESNYLTKKPVGVG